MILTDNGASCPSPDLTVTVSNSQGTIGNTVTTAHMGQTLTVNIVDGVSGNSCWGEIIIEDKFGPSIIEGCENMIMECADLAVFPGPTFRDNCDGPLEPVLLSEEFEDCPNPCLLYTSPSPRDRQKSRMPSSA